MLSRIRISYLIDTVMICILGAEYCGEKLADFFGITAPKYQYAINEYHRMKEEVGYMLVKQLGLSCGGSNFLDTLEFHLFKVFLLRKHNTRMWLTSKGLHWKKN